MVGSVIVIVEGANDNEGLSLGLGVGMVVGVVLVEGVGEERDAFTPINTSAIVGSALESKSVVGNTVGSDVGGCPETSDR